MRSRIAGAEALAAFRAVRRQQLDVITKVRASYLRLLRNYALLDLNEKNIASLRQIADVARSRYETGTESATDVLAETEASKLQETRRDFERMISDEKSQLNILMNRDAFTPRHPSERDPAPHGPAVDAAQGPDAGQRPEVRTAQAQVEAERKKCNLPVASGFPIPRSRCRGSAITTPNTLRANSTRASPSASPG